MRAQTLHNDSSCSREPVLCLKPCLQVQTYPNCKLDRHGGGRAFNASNGIQAADRTAGMSLLEVAFQHCSSKIFLQNFPTWSTQLIALGKSHRDEDKVISLQPQSCFKPERFSKH